jgi:Flp pilus assembly protein TadG
MQEAEMRGAFGFLPDRVRDDRGSALVLVALSAFALLSISALAIDIGMLLTARDEAQRTADASALAAAAEYLKTSATDAVAPGKQWAKNLAAENDVRNEPVDTTLVSTSALVDSTEQMVVQMMPDSFKARVTVYRPALGLWFARIFGVNTWGVAATAVAQATDAGAAKCLKPFVMPDIWSEATQDGNGDRVEDNGESWTYDPNSGDSYEAFDGNPNNPNATGYGSQWRNGYGNGDGIRYDYGRQITLKYQNPLQNKNQSFVPTPGIFLPWDLPDSTGSTQPGGAAYRQNIQTCNTNTVQLGVPYPIENGNMVGPTYQGVTDLIAQDPNASWDPTSQVVVGSSAGSTNWMNSPRVVKLAMSAPGQLYSPGKQTVVFNNFALFFIEGMNSNHDAVTGRFLYYATGDSNGPVNGSLVKQIRLVH